MKKINSLLITLEFNKELIEPNGYYVIDFWKETIREYKDENDDDLYCCRGSKILEDKEFKDHKLI